MFAPLTARPRGFSGRPLAALVCAVALGIAESYVDARLHLSDAVSSAIIVAIIASVAFVWYRIDH